MQLNGFRDEDADGGRPTVGAEPGGIGMSTSTVSIAVPPLHQRAHVVRAITVVAGLALIVLSRG